MVRKKDNSPKPSEARCAVVVYKYEWNHPNLIERGKEWEEQTAGWYKE